MDLAEETRKLFVEQSFEEAAGQLIRDSNKKEALENLLLYCLQYISDAREMSAKAMVLSTAETVDNCVIIRSYRGTKAIENPETFIKGIRNHSKEALAIISCAPFGNQFANVEPTQQMMQNLGRWAYSNNTPNTVAKQMLLINEFGAELRELSLLLLQAGHNTWIKGQLLLKMAELEIPDF